MDLKGKTALVPGAVKGIGKAIALALARAGANVVANWFDWEESLPSLVADLEAAGGRCLIRRTDLTDTEAASRLVQDTAAHFGAIDILVNNIERGGWPVVHGTYRRSQWDLEQATTLRAKQWLFEGALPHLKASGDGVVINISSIAGIVGRTGPASYVFNDGYAAANRGISMLTETWARLGAPEVRVNEIMLGLVETRHGPGTRGWGLLTAPQQEALRAHTLLGRTGLVSDVVDAVMFLITGARFMTGATIRLDGGYVLGGEAVGPMPEGVE
ncbi:MAG: SDR family oxidoreductase [Pseudomonadota bacterium]